MDEEPDNETVFAMIDEAISIVRMVWKTFDQEKICRDASFFLKVAEQMLYATHEEFSRFLDEGDAEEEKEK